LNFFPNCEEEISLLKHIACYQYLNVNDEKYFFKTERYYKQRIRNLIKKKFIKRVKLNLILDELGIEYIKIIGEKYNKVSRDKKYLSRLLYISNLGAFFNNTKNLKFTPSFSMKEKNMYTAVARKFIGVFEINGIEYLSYSITNRSTTRYINSVIYDIQKEKYYINFIIFIDDKSRININDLAFGANQVLIIEDNDIERERLKYINSIDWYKLVKQLYNKENIYLSNYNFCEYTNFRNKFITTFYFIDTEKINRIKFFLKQNKNKTIDIVCSKELKDDLIKELPTCNYIDIDLEKYIEKDIKIYD